MFPMSKVSKSAILISIFLFYGISLQAAGPSAKQSEAPYMNPALPIAERVNDLVSRMTLQEKVLQMQHTAPAIPRLGIPSYDWWNEALHGVARSGHATVISTGNWNGRNMGYRTGTRRRTCDCHRSRAKYNQAQREGNHSIYYGLTFWSLTSISSAIHAGAVARRLTAKTHSSPRSLVWPS